MAICLVVELVSLILDLVGLMEGLFVDLLKGLLVQLGFQVVCHAPVGWEVVLIVCLEVAEEGKGWHLVLK